MNETIKRPTQSGNRHMFLIGVVAFALTAFMLLAQALAASAEPAAAELGVRKVVDRSEVVPTITDTVRYTIVISNNGTVDVNQAMMTDVLTIGLTFAGNLQATAVNGSGVAGISGQTITWTGSLASGGYATIVFQASVSNTLPIGTVLTNTAVITGTGVPLSATAVTQIITQSNQFLPIIYKPIPAPILQATRPNSANAWTLSWNDVGSLITGYEIQESKDPGFNTLTNDSPGNIDLTYSHPFNPALSEQNVYYYRVRAVAGAQFGSWSNVVKVIGGYRSDFNSVNTNWAVRRMTYLEKTFTWVGTGNDAGNLIAMVDDKWDWLVASPLTPAPAVPYAIETRIKTNHQANLLSSGIVFGGDWNGGSCPEIGNVYQTTNCFNHFYNFNLIWYGPIKLLHEQVNELVWCPTCGGSPLKRLGPTDVVAPIVNLGDANGYHTYRIEVRQNGVSFFVDGTFIKKYTDTTWINEPYFGVFASTDEYKPSIWFYDYYQVTPLN